MTNLFPYHNFFNSHVGFDNLFRELESLATKTKIPTWPPYNIVKKDENTYVIEMAVAGFGKSDIEITLDNGTLRVRGGLESAKEDDSQKYLYKGIAQRAFNREFKLADYVEVKNADLFNGVLKVVLERMIPEEKKPKKIDIGDGAETKQEAAPASGKQLLQE